MIEKKGQMIRMSMALIAIALVILGGVAATAAIAAVSDIPDKSGVKVSSADTNYHASLAGDRSSNDEDLIFYAGNLITELPGYKRLKSIASAINHDGLVRTLANTPVRDYAPQTGDMKDLFPVWLLGLCLGLIIMRRAFKGPKIRRRY